MTGVYNGDAGWFDGLTNGITYSLEEFNDKQYVISMNDNGETSTVGKHKFVDLKEDLLIIAERSVEWKAI